MTWQPLPLPVRHDPGREVDGSAKAVEAADPYQATVVALSTPGHDGGAAMARTFVEEFARMGWPRERIARMFRISRYVAAHAVYRARGPEFVASIIDDVLGPVRAAQTDGEG